MARHLEENAIIHFTNLIEEVKSPALLVRQSAFDRTQRLKSTSRCRYSDLYKADVTDLQRLPLYTIASGIHHPLWHNFRTVNIGNSYGDSFFGLARRVQERRGQIHSRAGVATNVVYDTLQSTRRANEMHKGLLLAPILANPSKMLLRPGALASFMEECIDNISMIPSHMYSIGDRAANKGTYNLLYCSLGNIDQGHHFFKWQFKKGTVSTCYGALVDFTRGKVLAMLTLNREYLDYFLLHKYSESKAKMHPEIFNLVVDEEFSKNSGEHYAKELWHVVRKGIVNKIDPRITTEKIDGGELFTTLYSNNVNEQIGSLGPIEQIEENEEVQEEFIQSTVSAYQIGERNIILTD